MKFINTLLLVVGVGFLAGSVWTIGATELCREMSSLGWGLVPFVLGEGVAEMIHTVGWRHCLNGIYRSLPWFVLFRIRMAGYAINYLTPTASLGGELTKAALLASRCRGPEAVSGVLAEKVALALAHVIFVCLGLLMVLRRADLSRALWTSMVLSALLVAGGIAAFLFLQERGQLGWLIRSLAARKNGRSMLKTAAAHITQVDQALRSFYREHPLDLWRAVVWHLLGFSVGIFQAWFFFHLLIPHASLGMATASLILGMWCDLLTFAVPLNAGSLEGSRMMAARGLGFSALLGLTYGLALRLAQFFWAGVGLALYAWQTGTCAPRRPHSQSISMAPDVCRERPVGKPLTRSLPMFKNLHI
jgi:hypothetical protein